MRPGQTRKTPKNLSADDREEHVRVEGVGIRVCPLPWFHLLQHVNAKRDSIYCKTQQWKYYWLQNATRYVISKWCLLQSLFSTEDLNDSSPLPVIIFITPSLFVNITCPWGLLVDKDNVIKYQYVKMTIIKWYTTGKLDSLQGKNMLSTLGGEKRKKNMKNIRFWIFQNQINVSNPCILR